MAYDTRKPWRKWYGLARWQQIRQAQLGAEPLCRFCLDREVVEEATVVDHIVPHRGNDELFWDASNVQSLCASCHDNDKRDIERGKRVIYTGVDGYPINLE